MNSNNLQRVNPCITFCKPRFANVIVKAENTEVFTMKNFVRRVIRAQLEHLTSLLSMEGEECFIITACIVDGSSHLFGSTKGVEYIQNYFKGVVEEILPYLMTPICIEWVDYMQ
ncbi:uncharacterized protein LOC128211158 [Mya arenaria]|uniref:uncharacterized protein LOC128211158 n=1 Tax=Mya arenaria TaxID=6604 RepID=UPI0022E50D2C|nr:uncharacterized protein LOC128211158 [Mya arenaria]